MRTEKSMGRVTGICVLILLAAGSLQAQQKKLKVLISADMEGVGGVSTWEIQADPKGREYEKFRRLMTLEVNSAIAGAMAAGATDVLVADSHGDGQNIDMELLDKRARLIRAWPRPLGMMQGDRRDFRGGGFHRVSRGRRRGGSGSRAHRYWHNRRKT